MGTWNDEVDEPFKMIAGGMLAVARVLDAAIEQADEDTDLTILIDTRQWLRDRACLFAPPGEPEDGYPEEKNSAQVINLDAWREWRRIEKRQA